MVRRLIAAQFPQWSHLDVVPVELDGWDNRTYRLGERMSVRLPTAEGYVPAIAKENRWLPVLAPQLPLPIPQILGSGRPGEGYGFPWSIRRWLDGEPAQPSRIADLPRFAVDLARFLNVLHRVPVQGGPAAGAHSWYRGASLLHYDEETRRCLAQAGDLAGPSALAVWQQAISAPWAGPAAWFHGDVAAGNLLVKDGELAAVIDLGTCGVGDPACDLVIAWTLFSGTSRAIFRREMARDDGMWARARGWALWKALLTLAGDRETANLGLIEDLLAMP